MQNFENRRDRFELFDRMDSPALNLTFTMNLPDFRPWCKAQGLPVFHVMLYAVLNSVMKIENFRYRILDGEVIRVDRITPSYTAKNQNHDLNFAMFEWSDNLREFVQRSQAAGQQASGMVEMNQDYRFNTPREAKEQVFITCIPWLDFTSIQHPTAALAEPDIPSLAWGKFKDAAPGRISLPFSVQVHHGFVDGYHIHLFAQQVEAELNALMN